MTVFVASYFIVPAVWAFHAARLWVPLIPLLLLVAVSFGFQPSRLSYKRSGDRARTVDSPMLGIREATIMNERF